MPGIIYVFNQETQSNEYSNRSLGESLGYLASEIQEMGANFMPLVAHPDDLPPMAEHFDRVRSMADDEIAQFAYRIRHKDGAWRWLVSYDSVFDRDAEGRVLRHIGVAADITAQKEAEAELARRNAELAALNEELAQLAFAAAHDLKAPLANVASLVDLLLAEVGIPDSGSADEPNTDSSDTDRPGTDTDRSNTDSRNTDRSDTDGPQPDWSAAVALAEMIRTTCRQANDRLVDITKVTQARLELREDPVAVHDLGDLLTEVVGTFGPQLAAANGRVEIDLEVPAIRSSELALRSMLDNLIVNAITHANPDGDLIVRVTSRQEADGLKVCVSDNGRGVPEGRDAERIFELFRRGSGEQSDGAGIGLYLVRTMMLRLGGGVTVDRSELGGARFTLTFPAELAS